MTTTDLQQRDEYLKSERQRFEKWWEEEGEGVICNIGSLDGEKNIAWASWLAAIELNGLREK